MFSEAFLPYFKSRLLEEENGTDIDKEILHLKKMRKKQLLHNLVYELYKIFVKYGKLSKCIKGGNSYELTDEEGNSYSLNGDVSDWIFYLLIEFDYISKEQNNKIKEERNGYIKDCIRDKNCRALKLADKICIMKDGKVQQYDTVENLLRNPANEFVRNFIGSDRLWSTPEYIKARDIMIKNPVSVQSSRTVIQGMEIMRTNKVDSLLVKDKEDNFIGIITIKELRQNGIQNHYLSDIMNKEPLFVYDDNNLVEILEVMNRENIGHIPVITRYNKLAGLITRSSLLSVLSEQFLEMEVSVLG